MAKPQMLQMGRDYTLRTTRGHTIRFKKRVPRLVPGAVVEQAMRFGAFPPDNASQEALASEQEAQAKQEQVDKAPEGQDRKDMIRMQIESMVERNARGDFNASGRPSLEVMKKELGFDLTAQERDEVYDALKAEKAGAEKA